MASDSPVDPALDLGTQLKNFDGHGDSPFSIPGSLRIGGRAQATPHQWRQSEYAHLTDRFQYLSVNIV
jgi:hypothetical protein